MQLRLLASLVCLVIFSKVEAKPELQFASTRLEIKAEAQDKTLEGRYAFTNSSAKAIWIVQVSTSCGCTTAIADKTEYQPGETGNITATYTIGLSEGRHTYTISVQTSEPNTAPYELKFVADIPTAQNQLAAKPPPISVKPSELIWLKPPYSTKTIEVQKIREAKLVATCDNEHFEMSWEEKTNSAFLHLTPRPTASPGQADVILQCTEPDGRITRIRIPLSLLEPRK